MEPNSNKKEQILAKMSELREELDSVPGKDEELTEITEISDTSQLTQTMNHYRDFFNFAPVGLLSLDNEGRVLEANLDFYESTGVREEDLINQSLINCIPDKFTDVFAQHLMQTFERGEAQHELEIRVVDDNWSYPAMLDSRLCYASDGTVFSRTAVIDITEQKKAEIQLVDAMKKMEEQNEELKLQREELRSITDELEKTITNLSVHQEELRVQNEELMSVHIKEEQETWNYRKVYDFAPLPMLSFDINGLLTDVNLRAVDLLGIKRLSVRGVPLCSMILQVDLDRFNAFLLELKDEISAESVLRLKTQSGDYQAFTFYGSVSNFESEQKSMIRVILVPQGGERDDKRG